MATHSNILAWTIPWTEEPGGLQSIGNKDSDTTEAAQHSTRHIFYLDEIMYVFGLWGSREYLHDIESG